MGYTGPYSLGRRCMSEFISMAVCIFFGESIIANEVLQGTKGHEMGWGFIALGFGLSFYIPIQMFGVISAFINPAALIALWVIGDLDAVDFFALSAAELAGAFVGAVFVWLLYLPHFSTVPTPPHLLKAEYLNTYDRYTRKALKLASYTPHPDKQVAVKGLDKTLEQAKGLMESVPEHEQVEKFLDRYFHNEPRQPSLRRRTVQIADLEREAAKENLGGVQPVTKPVSPDPATVTKSTSDASSPDQHHLEATPPVSTPAPQQPSDAVVLETAKAGSRHNSREVEAAMEAYYAARKADQNIKLAIFATRPAIYNPLYNWIAEFLGTVALIFCALFFGNSFAYVEKPVTGLANLGLSPFLTGMLIFVLVLGLGGPTGYAVNCARDMGPRIAHFLLPIPGKGSSEFIYSWVPFTAALAGGAVAGGFYLLVLKLFIPPTA